MFMFKTKKLKAMYRKITTINLYAFQTRAFKIFFGKFKHIQDTFFKIQSKLYGYTLKTYMLLCIS